MNKKSLLISSFLIIVLLLGGAFYFFKNEGNEDTKKVSIEVISTRDNYHETFTYKTNSKNLGELLKAEDLIKYEDSSYGIYIREVKGIKDDQDNEYWWAILVNGESSVSGADDTILEDGTTYTLELKKGY